MNILVYWPFIDKCLSDFVREFEKYQLAKFPRKVSNYSCETRINVDYAGAANRSHFFAIVNLFLDG